MNNRTIVFALVLLTVLACLWPGLTKHACARNPRLIKFATIAPEGSTWVTEMRRLDKALRRKSEGRLGLKIYAGGIAGDELDVLRKIRIGQIQCTAFSGVGLAQILPRVRVLDLPFLFRSLEEADRVHQALRDYFTDQFREKGFELLSWAEIGNVYLFSKKPIRRMSDLAGLKIWTWSGDPISKETFSLMGTNPIPLSVTDVTTALNTGMIDTFYAPPLGALSLQWHTQVAYMMSLALTHATGSVLISRKHFNALSQDLKTLLRDAFSEAMRSLTAKLREQNMESIGLIRQSGVEILPAPTGEDLGAFYDIHDRVAQRLAGEVYPRALLDRVYTILGRIR